MSDPSKGSVLAGRCALVTGGSVGIGRAIATGLLDAGANVAIQYSVEADAIAERADAGDEFAGLARTLGRQAVAIPADFAQSGEAHRTVEHASAELGEIDVLVIAASVQVRSEFAAIVSADVEHQVAVNFAATIELLQAALPGMASRGWGRVLSIGSVNQVSPDPELAVYAALKAAQHNLIVNLARVYAPRGVTLNTLSPGLVATDRNRARRDDPEAWARIQAAANPMARAASPDEMVGAALMFCSDAGAFITGADLQATGGGHL